jgi:hypothetical protein
MKLTYRGVSYDHVPAQQLSDNAVVEAPNLRYRGAKYRQNQVAKAENLNALLKYRGVAYSTQPVAAAPTEAVAPVEAAAPVAAPKLSIQEKARLLNMDHHRMIKNREQSMLARSAAEVGLATDAANFWNHIQGKIQPTFRVNYDRSHAALS